MKRDLDPAIARPLALERPLPADALACTLAIIAILALHWETASSMVAIWWRSETFAHGFVVVPIALWFVWRQRADLARVAPSPWWPGIALVAGAGVAWLIGSVADAVGLRQVALVLMLQAAIVSVLGLRVARVIAFPLAFLLFAVPVGEFLVPTLIDRTADFTVGAVRLTGVPVFREGNQFVIPSGTWSVVEACSGVRYIIASLMVGTMYAAIAYRSWKRRALFVLASILVPVVANWVRAFMIVMLGHLSNNRLAVGVDHIFYGWVFFGVVMLLLFWIASRWAEDDPVDTRSKPEAGVEQARRGAVPGASLAAAVAAVVAATIWVPIAGSMRIQERSAPDALQIAGADGWTVSATPATEWRPRYAGYATDYRKTYVKGEREVGLQVVYYRNQRKGAELITSTNMLAQGDDPVWKVLAEGSDQIEWQGRTIRVDRVLLRGPRGPLEVFRFYRVAGWTTSNQYFGKALLAWSRMLRRGDDAALILLVAPVKGQDVDAARATLRDFAASMAEPIGRALAIAEASGR